VGSLDAILVLVCFFYQWIMTIFFKASLKRIFTHFFIALIILILLGLVYPQVITLTEVLEMYICILGIIYVTYLRNKLRFNQPMFSQIMNYLKNKHKFELIIGYDYNGNFSDQIFKLKNTHEDKVVLAPVFAFKETSTQIFYLTLDYVVYNINNGSFINYREISAMTNKEQKIFHDLEKRKIEVINNLDKK
jgi:hypothetical protein